MFEEELRKSSEEIRSEPWFNEGEYYSEGYSCGYDRGFQNGAEIGYNKGKKVEQWHILAENSKDVPAENSVVKVLTEDNIIQESTYFYDDYFEEMAFSNVGLVKVLAWKELSKE